MVQRPHYVLCSPDIFKYEYFSDLEIQVYINQPVLLKSVTVTEPQGP